MQVLAFVERVIVVDIRFLLSSCLSLLLVYADHALLRVLFSVLNCSSFHVACIEFVRELLTL